VQRVVVSDVLEWVGVTGVFGGGNGWRWWRQKVLGREKPRKKMRGGKVFGRRNEIFETTLSRFNLILILIYF
jgi:hypothetical protein